RPNDLSDVRRRANCRRRRLPTPLMASKETPDPSRLGILISGRGSNLQSIIDAVATGALDASIAVVISNRPDAQGLQRARDARIDALYLDPRDYPDRHASDRAI